MIAILLAWLLSRPAWCQETASSDQQATAQLVQQIKELQQHERELEDRIKLLEANQKPALPAAPNPPDSSPSGSAVAPAPPSPPPNDSSPAVAQAPAPLPGPPTPLPAEVHSMRGIQWRGFAEVDYKVLDQRVPETGTYGFVPGSAGNFYTGDFGLFLTSHFSDRISGLTEIVFEENDAQSFRVDLRRVLLKYDATDHLHLAFGRYQTNIGYYNWAFRSASFLQTTADRPLVMEYASNGGVLPTQAIGVSVTGSIPSGKLGLNYIVEYGSSDTIRPDINGDGLLNDENNGNQINGGLFASPDRVPGLRIGGSIYHDQISDLVSSASTGQLLGTQGVGGNIPSPSERWNQTIANGHIVYTSHGIEFLNEGFLIRHAPIGPGETFHTPAFYSQFSKRLGPVRPFFRYQYINAADGNAIYNDIGLRYGPSFGARYDITDYCAFKAQLDHTVRRGLPDLNGLHLQLSGTF